MTAPLALRRLLALLGGVLLALFLAACPAVAQSFPPLTGRVVDAAHVLPADVAARLEGELAALEAQSQRQMVVATLPDLQGYEVADYANLLFRNWKLGDKGRNDGVLLLIAPEERKLRIEVGYGMEGIVTDGLSFLIIRDQITPNFKAGDLPGGIEAGADALIRQLMLPEDQARQIAAKATLAAKPQNQGNELAPALVWLGFFFLIFVLPALRRRGGRGFGGGLGPVILWDVMNSGGRGGGWGGGGGGDWGGGGGFSGGGGSSGGGGASGGW